MKTLTDFEKIAGYLTVLEEQQAIVTDMINEMAEAKNDAFDAILEAKVSLNLATEALKQQLAELNHIETQKTHMHHVLCKLESIRQATLTSLNTTAGQLIELTKTVPAQVSQNITETLQHMDIAGAVRQRTDVQMETIADQVKALSDRSSDFVAKIMKAEDNLKLRYEQLKIIFWWLIGGAILSVAIVTGVSAKIFFSQGVDNNYNAINFTYQKTVQLEKQLKVLEIKMDKALNNAEKLKKK